ncbi:MAG: hypothetical protein KF708_17700 [Pirellulales bacterium]|nr:hypothetical protein [Pirellulales bacterium]
MARPSKSTSSVAPLAEADFLFVTCQVGAEAAVKGELARLWPDFRFAYSRPGFLTFKLPAGHRLNEDFALGSVFARAWGFSLGKATGDTDDERAAQAWQLLASRDVAAVHVWPRDRFAAGSRGYTPGLSDASQAAVQTILQGAPATFRPNRELSAGDRVLDVVLVDEGVWWIGFHRVQGIETTWPGGFSPLELPADAVSRAYLKLEEGLLWSGLPLKAGERCAEIGAAPGGASQALLARGLHVLGIDPAEIDPRVAEHPHFTHVRKRGADVRRREFRKTRWLLADMNVAPQYTLDTIEAIVLHPEIDVRGLLLTLKLLEWSLADEVPDYLERIRVWDFEVRARQLQHNRQEICVAALRSGGRRPG